jgi:hypothetical protein
MWAIIAGAVAGLLLGGAIGHEFLLFGAIAGALVGGYFSRNRQPAGMSRRELAQRLLVIEKRLAEQRGELEMLRRQVAGSEQSAVPPVIPTGESDSTVSECASEPPASTVAAGPAAVRPPSGREPEGRRVDLDALLEPRRPSAGSAAAAPRPEGDNGRRPSRPDGCVCQGHARDRRRPAGSSGLAQVVLADQPARQDRHRSPLFRRRLGSAPWRSIMGCCRYRCA